MSGSGSGGGGGATNFVNAIVNFALVAASAAKEWPDPNRPLTILPTLYAGALRPPSESRPRGISCIGEKPNVTLTYVGALLPGVSSQGAKFQSKI